MATTLVTFIFDCPVVARTVELFGSWDNFERSYLLKLDKRRSTRTWSGCFSFQSIICDGDPSHTGPGRDGGLMVGGTYWYYYKVNDDEEHYDPCKPSTSVCPLLPGQRLNILDVPMEVSSSDDSAGVPAFTRNPQDRYLTPIPPKPLVSQRLGDLCKEPYTVPTHTYESLYSKNKRSLAPKHNRRMRSATLSPHTTYNSSFSDLKEAKDSVTSRFRSSSDSRAHKGHSDVRDLKIGAPVLISTTAEDMTLVLLQSKTPQSKSSRQAHIATRMKEFSPLGSHPVDLKADLGNIKHHNPSRPRSHNPAVETPMLKSSPGRIRANSADTRRTKYYQWANEPWVTSPRLPPGCVMGNSSKPTLERPNMINMDHSSTNTSGRPVSRRGGEIKADIRRPPVDKSLPDLPRYLVPAPLFACNSTATTTPRAEERAEDLNPAHTVAEICVLNEVRSHRSSSSIESGISGSPTSDQCQLHSPTFSSFTSGSSQAELSPRHSTQPNAEDRKARYESITESGRLEQTAKYTTGPPILRIPMSFAETDAREAESRTSVSSRRRRAACFGYTDLTAESPPAFTAENTLLNSAGQFEALMFDFGFLGEAVR